MDFWHMQPMFLNSYWNRSQDLLFQPQHLNLRWVFQLNQLQMVYRGAAVVISQQSRCGKKSEKGLSGTLFERVKTERVEYKTSEFQNFLGELGHL